MSAMKPSSGESLQEMIDRYNRELMQMGQKSRSRPFAPTSDKKDTEPGVSSVEHTAPIAQDNMTEHFFHGSMMDTTPRTMDMRDMPADNIMLRPAPDIDDRAPMAPPMRPNMPQPPMGGGFIPMRPAPQVPPRPQPSIHSPQWNSDIAQGLRDIEQGQRDREQGLRDIAQGQRDLEQGLRDLEQGLRDSGQGGMPPMHSPQWNSDIAQGLRDIEQGQRDREQGLRDIAQGQRDLEQGLRDLEQGLRDSGQGGIRPPHSPQWNADIAQGLRDIEQGQRDREQGLRDIAQGQRDLEQGLRDLEQGLRDSGQGGGRPPRPLPDEPIYRPDSFLPRPEPSEPLFPPYVSPHAPQPPMGGGFIPMRPAPQMPPRPQPPMHSPQWNADIVQGLRDIEQGQRDREQGLRDIAQGQRDLEQGLRDLEQGLRDSGQGGGRPPRPLPDEPIYRPDSFLPRPEPSEPLFPPFMRANAQPAPQEQWIRDLEQGRHDLEQGLADLEQGRRDLEQGLRDREEGLRQREMGMREREEGLAQSAQWLNSAESTAARTMRYGWQSGYPYANDGDTLPAVSMNSAASSDSSDRMQMPRTTAAASDSEGGTLRVQVSAARQAYPIANAHVVVTRVEPDGEKLYAVTSTDRSGLTPPISLPANMSGKPLAPTPMTYNVSVFAENFYPQEELPAQIYNGISATLPVTMIPLPSL